VVEIGREMPPEEIGVAALRAVRGQAFIMLLIRAITANREYSCFEVA